MKQGQLPLVPDLKLLRRRYGAGRGPSQEAPGPAFLVAGFGLSQKSPDAASKDDILKGQTGKAPET